MLRVLLAALLPFALGAKAATLTIDVEHFAGGAPLRFEQPQAMGDGREMTITRLDYLVTEFALLTTDGRALRADGQAAFLSAGKGRTTFTLPELPAGKYAGIAFRIGVPAAEAARDPASWPAGHPLNPAVNGLHWGWQGGYVFLALEGRAGAEGFSYHLARPENLMTVRLEQPVEIDGDTTFALRFDVARMFDGVAVRSDDGSNSSHSAPGDALAARMKSNAGRAWSFAGSRAVHRVGASVERTKIPAGTTAYALRVPNGFPAPELPADNPLTVEGVALGKRLFHDVRLSSNEQQSCASCHQPARAFTEPRAISTGAERQFGSRNAPTLLNLAWHQRFAWDGRREKLRDAALAPISDAREMNLPIAEAVNRIAADPTYRDPFAQAFGDGAAAGKKAVTAERVGFALEQFLLTCVGASSKFDRVLLGEASLSEEEARGFELFHTEFDPARGKRGADCFHCHGGFDFSDRDFHDTGLGIFDPGHYAATGREADRGKFKTPTLRNIARTAPYFHDGRAATLEEVVTHYDRGVQRTANLDPNLAKRGPLNLSPEDRQALVAFLKTLTDE